MSLSAPEKCKAENNITVASPDSVHQEPTSCIQVSRIESGVMVAAIRHTKYHCRFLSRADDLSDFSVSLADRSGLILYFPPQPLVHGVIIDIAVPGHKSSNSGE